MADKVDILFVIGEASAQKSDEFRYALRSLCKFGRNINKIYCVGYKPAWLSDECVFLDCPDSIEGYKHNNILNCIKQACLYLPLTDYFLYSSDDHFYVKPTDFSTYPIYLKESLQETMRTHAPTSRYQQSIQNTFEFLRAHDLPTQNYSWHGNTWYCRSKFLSMLPLVDEALQTFEGVEPACLMLNALAADPDFVLDVVERKDMKYYMYGRRKFLEDMNGRECFSMDDSLYIRQGKWWLRDMFPDKCIYEI